MFQKANANMLGAIYVEDKRSVSGFRTALYLVSCLSFSMKGMF